MLPNEGIVLIRQYGYLWLQMNRTSKNAVQRREEQKQTKKEQSTKQRTKQSIVTACRGKL